MHTVFAHFELHRPIYIFIFIQLFVRVIEHEAHIYLLKTVTICQCLGMFSINECAYAIVK